MRTDEVIGSPTWCQARDAVLVAAKIEIQPGTGRDNALGHTADVIGNATTIVNCIRARVGFCV